MEFLVYITENELVVISILSIIGIMLKENSKVKDKYIPILLLPIGILLSMGLRQSVSPDTIVQAVLVTATSVYLHQLTKQIRKSE